MEQGELDACLQEMFDNALLYHGFAPYMRDYEMVVYESTDPRSGIAPRYLQFVFRNCPEVHVRSSLRPEVWSRSTCDDLIEARHVTKDTRGYVWGVMSQDLYPGPHIVQDSARARQWTEQSGIRFHEVNIAANAHHINIVFSELSVQEIAIGYTPFKVGRNGVAEEYETGSKMPLESYPPELT
jgi:hypothetical protein